MKLGKIDIHELIPQREPFVMVGELVYFDMTKTVTSTEIKSDNIFVERGELTPYGLIENIAQTCAARIGYYNKVILRTGIQIGFIGAIRNMHIFHLPRVGESIETSITVVEEVFGMTLIKAQVKRGDMLLAESEMKIALGEESVIQ